MAPHPVTEYTSESSWAMVEDKFSPYGKETLAKTIKFLEDEILPAIKVANAQLPSDPVKRWQTVVPVVSELKEKAKKQGLWNLFLSKTHYPKFGVPLSNVEVCSQ
jgi:acyl-CoA dehydrogenase